MSKLNELNYQTYDVIIIVVKLLNYFEEVLTTLFT